MRPPGQICTYKKIYLWTIAHTALPRERHLRLPSFTEFSGPTMLWYGCQIGFRSEKIYLCNLAEVINLVVGSIEKIFQKEKTSPVKQTFRLERFLQPGTHLVLVT